MDQNDLDNRFTYHKPDASAVSNMRTIREAAGGLADFINDTVPDGREKALAITKLEEVVMWANAGIARQFTGE